MPTSIRFALVVLLSLSGCSQPVPMARQPLGQPVLMQGKPRSTPTLQVTPLAAMPAGLAAVHQADQQAFVTWARESNPNILAMAFQAGARYQSVQRLAAGGQTLGYYIGATGTATEVDEFGQMEAAFVQGFLYDAAMQPLVWMGSAYDVNEAQPPRSWTRWRTPTRSGFAIIGSKDEPETLQAAKVRLLRQHAERLRQANPGLQFKPIRCLDPVPCIELRLDGETLGWFTTAHTQGFSGSLIAAGFAFADWVGPNGEAIAGSLASLNPFSPAKSGFLTGARP